MNEQETIEITSGVSAKHFKPFVQLWWGKQGCQMTPNEAREHAYGILAAAEAAESDAILVAFLREKVGIKEGVDVSLILRDFRTFRERSNTRLPDTAHRHDGSAGLT